MRRFTEAILGYADPHMEKYYTKHNHFKCVIRLYSLIVYCCLVLNIWPGCCSHIIKWSYVSLYSKYQKSDIIYNLGCIGKVQQWKSSESIKPWSNRACLPLVSLVGSAHGHLKQGLSKVLWKTLLKRSPKLGCQSIKHSVKHFRESAGWKASTASHSHRKTTGLH